MILPKKENVRMSEIYFKSISSVLYNAAYFYYHKYRAFFKNFPIINKHDIAQIGVCGVLDMEDGHKLTMYTNRIKRRICDYMRYLKRIKRDDSLFSIAISDFPYQFIDNYLYDNNNYKHREESKYISSYAGKCKTIEEGISNANT